MNGAEDLVQMKIILYFKKRSSFPPNKGGTMKFMKYVAWGIAILRVFFSFKISGNEANNPTFALSLRSSLSFSKICFFNMFILVFFDHYLQIHKMFASERF